jgi:glycerophosphoryl diester phosphodiesterase
MQIELNEQLDTHPNTFTNLFVLKNSTKKRKTIIAGHRGGFKPDNTLYAFKKAKFHNLDMVELDVS